MSVINLIKSLLSLIVDSLKLFKQIKTYWGSLVLLIVPLAISIPAFNDFFNNIQVVAFSIIVILIAWLQSNNNFLKFESMKSKLDSLENQRDTLRESLEATPTMIVKHMYQEIGLSERDRITIYRYSEGKFINIGRFSLNFEFTKKGRKSYPKDKGFIGQCWENGSVYRQKLPKSDNLQRYIDNVSRISNIEKKILKDISMKSRCYYCKKLINSQLNPVAVIVIETLDHTLGDRKDRVDKTLEEQYGALLLESIEMNLPLGRG
ncbi:hypothetical protein BTR23_07500 [Alkalihalophilus pseudofirmus]|nr:hypothetical protein BTR23_07500 [Alkalihalophilus pseudofirmus]